MRIWKSILAAALAAAVWAGAEDRSDSGKWREGRMRGERYMEGHGPGSGDGFGPMSPRMMRELGLTPDQEKKLKEQRLAMEKRKIQLHADKAVLELDLRNILSTYPVNQGEAMKLGEKIAEVDKKALMLKVETWSKLLAGLTAEQHRKLTDLQAEFREKKRAWREKMEKDGR